jgi:hypothetical protein
MKTSFPIEFCIRTNSTARVDGLIVDLPNGELPPLSPVAYEGNSCAEPKSSRRAEAIGDGQNIPTRDGMALAMSR